MGTHSTHYNQPHCSKMSTLKTNLNVVFINVCGLSSRMKYPDFIDFLNNYDIICLGETKLDNIDAINIKLDGYSFYYKNRQQFQRKSGGLGIFVRQTLVDTNMFKILNVINPNIMLFQLDKSLCGDDVIGAVLYVEPEGSIYANPHVFDELENVLLNYFDYPMFLIGDFNARTNNMSDWCLINPYCNDGDDDNVMSDDTFEIFNIIKDRYSLDKKTNNHGIRLINMCIDYNLLIVNGREGQDAYVGKLTCREASLVDYCIASPVIFPLIEDFYITDFNECFSDVHCPVSVKLIVKSGACEPQYDQYNSQQTCQGSVSVTRPKWDDAMKDLFYLNLDVNRINAICFLLNDLVKDNNTTQYDVNNIYEEIKCIFVNSAKICGSIKTRNTNLNQYKRQCRKRSNLWWTTECELARKNCNKARNICKLNKSVTAESHRKECSKKYKNVIFKAVSNYNNEIVNTIRATSSNNSKEFWRIINSNKRQKDPS